MGLGKLLLIFIFTTFLSVISIYFISSNLILTIYNSKYQLYNLPEFGYFISLLESVFYSLSNLPVLLIIILISLIAGILYGNKKSFQAGLFNYIFLSFILIIFYYKILSDYYIIIGIGLDPNFFTDFSNKVISILPYMFVTVVIASLTAAIPGIIKFLKLKQKSMTPSLMTFNPTICPNCQKKYNSAPLICSKCGYIMKNKSSTD